jgi:hypothetical protein
MKVGKYNIPLFENSKTYGNNVLDVKRAFLFATSVGNNFLSDEYQREIHRKQCKSSHKVAVEIN